MKKTTKKKLPDPTEIPTDPTETEESVIEKDSPPEQPPTTVETTEFMDEWPTRGQSAAPEEADQPPADPAEKSKGGRPTNEERRKRLPILERLMELDSWQGIYLYLYRLRPVINKLMEGNGDTNIGRYEKPIDIQDILEEHGSGVYFARATRQDPKTGKRPQFDMGEIKIMNMKYPPKIPPGQWVEHPKNAEWEWAKDAIFGKPKPAADPIVDMLNRQLERQERQMDDLRREMREASAVKKNPDELTLASILAPFLPAIAKKLMEPPPDPMASLTAAVALLKQVTPAAAEPIKAADPEEALERALKLQDKIEERMGGRNNGRSRKTGTQEMITDIATALGPAVAPIVQMVAMNAMRAQQQQPQPGQQFIPQAPQQQPDSAAQWTPPGAPQQQQPPRPSPQPPATPKPTQGEVAEAILDHLRSGQDGFAFGDWYLDKYGKEEFLDARAEGAPQLMQDLQNVPNVWRFLAEYYEDRRLQQFLKEFVTWTEPDDEDDEDDDEDQLDAPTADAIKTGWTSPAPVEVEQ